MINNERKSDIVRAEERVEKTISLLDINKINISLWYTTSTKWENPQETVYSKIFNLIAPELQVGKSTEQICRFIGIMINPDNSKSLKDPWAIPSNTLRTIMTDFTIMGIIKVINPNKADRIEVWEISEFGRTVHAKYRMRMLEKNYSKEENVVPRAT